MLINKSPLFFHKVYQIDQFNQNEIKYILFTTFWIKMQKQGDHMNSNERKLLYEKMSSSNVLWNLVFFPCVGLLQLYVSVYIHDYLSRWY